MACIDVNTTATKNIEKRIEDKKLKYADRIRRCERPTTNGRVASAASTFIIVLVVVVVEYQHTPNNGTQKI